MSTCATCPRPADPRRGVCQPCYERELIRGARVRWQGAAEHRKLASNGLRNVVDQAFAAATDTTTDRAAWAAGYQRVADWARRALELAETANRLHAEASARALELWQLRGRVGVPALRAEDLPPEEVAP